jgi:hypothetical protein
VPSVCCMGLVPSHRQRTAPGEGSVDEKNVSPVIHFADRRSVL